MAVTNTRYVNASAANSAGGDGTTNNTSGSTRAYKTLSEWEAARAADLVAGDIIEEVFCDSVDDADTTRVDVTTTWVTDATRYIDIRAATRSRASTKWSTTKYRITTTQSLSFLSVIDFGTDIKYARVSGIQIEYSIANLNSETRSPRLLSINVTSVTDGSDIRISNCHMRMTGAAPFNPMTNNMFGVLYAPSTVGASPTPNFYVWNNIISWEATGTFSGTTLTGLRAENRNHNMYAYNNTIVGAWGQATGGDSAGTPKDHYLKNNIFSGCTVATEGDHTNTRCDYNSTNLSDLGYTAGSNDRVSQTFTFVASDDYAITGADAGARDHGLTDPGSGLFSDDIDGKTRSGSWDIGAFEYQQLNKRKLVFVN
jgi:hypothetical protein